MDDNMDYEDEDSSIVLNGSAPLHTIPLIIAQKKLPNVRTVFDWTSECEHGEEVPKRFGLCGAFSTGKSTLARSLSVALDIPLIVNVERSVAAAGMDINKKTDIVTQLTIWMAQFYEQLQVREFVSDMTYIDILAYLLDYQKQNDLGARNNAIHVFINVLQELIPHEYTMIFYNQIQGAPKADGIRSVDRKFQRRIDRIILGILESFQIEYVPLSGSLSDKVNTVLSYLG